MGGWEISARFAKFGETASTATPQNFEALSLNFSL